MSNLAGYNTINDVNLSGLSNVYADEITAEDVIVPRRNTNLTSILGPQINLTDLVQNLNWTSTTKAFEIWDNNGTGYMMSLNTDLNEMDVSPLQLNLFPANGLNIAANATYTGHTSSYVNHQISLNPNCNLNVNGASISPVELSYLDGLTTNIQSAINGIPTNYVTTNTDQTVGGNKTFTGNTTIGDTTFTDSLLVNGREELFNETNPYVTILNYAFDTPVRSLNTGATVSSPYTAITNWVFTLLSGSVPTVSTGRGFWDTLGPNSLVFYYPGYPTVTQCIGVRQNSASSFRLAQGVTIPTTGIYIVSFWLWGKYNQYSPNQSISSSIGTGSVSGIQASEQYWKKVQYRTYVTAGSHTVHITFNQTASVASTICLTNIEMQLSTGLTVGDNDTGIGNSNLINPTGVTTNTIYNEGQLWNYGDFTLYGSFAPFLTFVKNSSIIGDCKYGSRSTDTGEHNYIFGFGVATNVKQGGSNGTFNRLIAIGSGATEQATTITDAIAIGRFANRYSGSDTSICIGTNAGQYFGYSNRTNMSNNIAIGHESIGAVFSTGNQYNLAIGNSAMRTGGDFTNPRAYNTVIGHSAGYSLASNNNTIVGYQACNNMLNITSTENSFFGNQSGTTQTGAGNVLSRCTFLGASSDVNASGSYSNSTAIGYNAKISSSNQIVLGGSNGGTFPNVLLPNKNILRAVQTVGAVATFNITFGMSENIEIDSTTTSAINLPTPSAENVGTKWYIYKKYTDYIQVDINPPASQNIFADQQFLGTYYLDNHQMYVTIVCVGSSTAVGATNYIAESTALFMQPNINANITGVYTFQTDPVFNNNSIPNEAVIGFDSVVSTLTNIGYDAPSDETTISSTAVRVNAIASTTAVGGTVSMQSNVNFWQDVYLNDNVWKLNGFTELSGSPNNLSFPLSRVYILTTSANGAVTLPLISADMYGIEITFIKNSASNTYTINRSGSDTFRLMGSNGVATATSVTLEGRNTVLKVVAQQATVWAVVIDNFQGTEAPLITASTTLSHPFYESYSIATPNTTAITITLPTADITTEGLRFLFRRTNTTMAPVNSASANIRPINNGTQVNTILTNAQYLCEIGVFKTGATAYGWFLLRTA